MLKLLGAIAWSAHVALRAMDPQAFVAGALPSWHFKLYTVLTLTAYFVLGFGLLRLLGGRPWQAYFLMGVSLLFLIMYLQLKDLPPFVHYLLGLVLGISLLRV
jgi:4-hydroxybenzoate polyprenyltransferase